MSNCCFKPTLQTDRQRLAGLVREHLGDDILRQVQQPPPWRDNIEASRAKMACRHARSLV